MKTVAKRFTQGAGIALISDGVMGLANPEQHGRRWESAPALWQRALRPLVRDAHDHRAFAVAEIAVGFAVVWVVPRVLRRR